MKDIPGYEGRYAITRDGKVWSYPKPLQGKLKHLTNFKTKGKWLTPYIRTGYFHVKLGYKSDKSIHRLLAITYIENKNNKKCVNHIDGNKQNNNIENLEWCTHQENCLHANKIGLCRSRKKLSIEQCKEISRLIKSGKTKNELARLFNVNKNTIFRAYHKIGYKY